MVVVQGSTDNCLPVPTVTGNGTPPKPEYSTPKTVISFADDPGSVAFRSFPLGRDGRD